jgi:hypothetical protein
MRTWNWQYDPNSIVDTIDDDDDGVLVAARMRMMASTASSFHSRPRQSMCVSVVSRGEIFII